MVLRLRYPKKKRFTEKEMQVFYANELQDLVRTYPLALLSHSLCVFTTSAEEAF
jgi:hypothetical protein